jgi:hypothetical protein
MKLIYQHKVIAMRRVAFLVMLIVCIFPLFGQGTNDSNSLQSIKLPDSDKARITTKCNDFFNAIIKENYKDAFTNLLVGSTIGEKKEQITNLIDQTKRANEIYGMMKSYEYVSSDVIGQSLIRVRYLSLHSEYPMRWLFTFYKSPDKGWVTINVKFDDVTDLFFND